MTELTNQNFITSQWVRRHNSFELNVMLTILISVLHPRHKLQYFQRVGWIPEWIRTAETILRNEFDRTYRFRDIAEPTLVNEPVGVRHLFLSPSA